MPFWTHGAALLLAAALQADGGADRVFAMYVRNGIAELGLSDATPEGRDKIARLKASIRDELRDRAVIAREARRRNLPIAQRLDARRAQWIARLGGEASYRAYLAEHRLTDADFDRVVGLELAAELLRAELIKEVAVTDAEITAFYARERSNPALESLFVRPETVTASHILIAARPGLHADIDARRTRAERIRRALLEGAEFAALAREHSDDAGTRARGGDLGAFTRDTHTEAFDRAAFTMTAGEISPVIQTEFGFHIIRVTARAPRGIHTLAELRPAIEARILTEKAAAHLKRWLEQQRLSEH